MNHMGRIRNTGVLTVDETSTQTDNNWMKKKCLTGAGHEEMATLHTHPPVHRSGHFLCGRQLQRVQHSQNFTETHTMYKNWNTPKVQAYSIFHLNSIIGGNCHKDHVAKKFCHNPPPKKLSQNYACCNKQTKIATKSWQNYVCWHICHNKKLSWQKFWHNKHNFVVINMCLLRQNIFYRDKVC